MVFKNVKGGKLRVRVRAIYASNCDILCREMNI